MKSCVFSSSFGTITGKMVKAALIIFVVVSAWCVWLTGELVVFVLILLMSILGSNDTE